jgi:hypothetical protein
MAKMAMLKLRYAGLLNTMNEEYKNDDGTTLTFKSENFCGRISALMCLFQQFGVTDKEHFDILSDDWKWEHYLKVIADLKSIGAVDSFGLAVSPVCARVTDEMGILFGGEV